MIENHNALINNLLKEPIDSVVLSPEALRFTRDVARECRDCTKVTDWYSDLLEQGGIMEGTLRGKTFYVMGQSQGTASTKGELDIRGLDWPERTFQERLAKQIPGYRQLMYHAHYGLNEEILRKHMPESVSEVINFFREEIDSGIYDYLEGNGKKPSLQRVLNEVLARQLSETDFENNIGKYHLLLSPTLSEQDIFSHLNFYRIDDKTKGLATKIKVREPNKKEERLFSFLRKKGRDIYFEHYSGILGFDLRNIENLTEEQREEAFRFLVSRMPNGADPYVAKVNGII